MIKAEKEKSMNPRKIKDLNTLMEKHTNLQCEFTFNTITSLL